MIRYTLLFLILLSIKLLSQNHIAFNHLTVEDGLSQSSVTCIFQDSKGFMWFGTQDGLNRYDGYKFNVYKSNSSDSTTLTQNFIFSIFEDEFLKLYIETQNGTIHKFFPKTESFEVVDKDSIDLSHARISSVGAVFTEPNGIKWMGGLGNATGLEKIDTKTGAIMVYNHNETDPHSLSSDKVYSIFRDSRRNLWIGTANGLDKLDESTGKFIHFRNNSKDPNSIADNWVWPIFEDSKGSLWIGTVRGGLCKFDYKTKKFTNYRNDPNEPTSLNDNFVFSINEDKGGGIWIGTNLGGVNYFHPNTLAFELYKSSSSNSNSLSDNVVYSMLVDKYGGYWIGTRSGGLNKFNYDENKFTAYKHDPKNSNSLLSNSIQSLLEDRSGNIWIGTFSSGLNKLNPATNTFTKYINDPSNAYSLSDNRIYSLLEDNDANIWIGTYRGGLNKLNVNTNKITRIFHNPSDSTTISSDAAWSLSLDDKGNLWIGTFGGGINILNLEDNTITKLQNNVNDSGSIIDDNIIRVFKDRDGTMWIGTTKGLSKYSFKNKTFTNYDDKDGLSNNFVYGILQDHKGNLWLSTNDGLSCFNPKEETFKNYYNENGLQGDEFNQNAFAKDYKTGRLLFGGTNGFNVFYPDSIKDNNYVPPIVLTDYLRYNTDDEEGKPIFEKGISERDSLMLTYKDNIINVKFSALSYFNNFNNQYKYHLEGFIENWIQLGNNHSVTLTNLSPGDYTLQLIGSNNEGVWNETGETLFISIMPPWWRTNIAYIIYGLALASILLTIRRVEKKSQAQKAQTREYELLAIAANSEKRALEIENERQTKELEEARQLQLSMLPKELPKLAHLEIAAFMRTATEVGGDYYDFIVQENGVLNVAFGDATGHGLQAGTMVTLMKGFFTSDAAKRELPDFMNHCSSMIKEIKLGRILMSFSFIRITDNKMSITSAGMPPIYYYNSASKEIEEIIIPGMPLGAMRKFAYNVIEKELKSGDTILLLTDGLPEQMNNNEEMFDYPRVKEYFGKIAENNPTEIIEKLTQSGDDWMNGSPQGDDISFIVIRKK